jgi:glc operon protein GlcG
MTHTMLRSIAAVLALASSAAAQIVEKKALTLAGAEQVILAAKAEAKRLNAPGGVIAVVDDGGNLMALARLDGTFAAGANISIGKARTAALFKKPTRFFEDVVKNGRTSMVALKDFTPLQGGVPITVDGQIIGAVGASGAASAAQDEELAIACANALSSDVKSQAGSRVSFFPAQEVRAAFQRGSILLNGNGRNYMIHASRREKPGGAEVHTQDADLIYVLDGTATFVTGGSVISPSHIDTDEIRGSGIDGGETRTLAKGDVIVVPAGTPHWFKQVTDPFLYYVVKVR